MGGGGPTRGKHRWKRHRCRETTRKRGGRERLAGWCAPLTPSSLAGDQSHRACGFKWPNHRRVFFLPALRMSHGCRPPFLCPCGGILLGGMQDAVVGGSCCFAGRQMSLWKFLSGSYGSKGEKVQNMNSMLALIFFVKKVHVLTRKATVVPPLPKPWMAPQTGRGAWT